MSIELKAITKKFGSLVANDSIDLKVARGEIHAILGENGAGKSTLMNIVYGLAKADSGKIFVEDKEVIINEPADALRYGIGMVHQHFMLIPVFTVAENIALGREESRGVFLTLDEVKKKIKALADEFKFDIDPDALIEDLPVGVQQRVEIIKALIYDAKVLILDEPTAVLTPQETDELLNIMRTLKKKGTSIIFITHKLREVKDVADKITIIRLGKVVGTTSPDTSQEDLASMMVGRQVDLAPNKSEIKPGRVILDVNKLNVANSLGRKIINSLSLQVKAGEILAIAGVQGNGQSELAEAIVGLQEIDPFIIESAMGMGMTPKQALRQIELPLAVPVILAGVRTTLILTVGVATLGVFVNGGGLGTLIIPGLKLNRELVLVTGGMLTVIVAFTMDWLARAAEELLRPRGI